MSGYDVRGLSIVAQQAVRRAEFLGITVEELREREPGWFDYEQLNRTA
jgi:hypothetical protein